MLREYQMLRRVFCRCRARSDQIRSDQSHPGAHECLRGLMKFFWLTACHSQRLFNPRCGTLEQTGQGIQIDVRSAAATMRRQRARTPRAFGRGSEARSSYVTCRHMSSITSSGFQFRRCRILLAFFSRAFSGS